MIISIPRGIECACIVCCYLYAILKLLPELSFVICVIADYTEDGSQAEKPARPGPARAQKIASVVTAVDFD